MIGRLETWREGSVGTVLFYGYLVGIVVTAIVVVALVSSLRAQTHRLDVQGDRQCRAIAGAIVWWEKERTINYAVLADQTSTPGQRDRAASRISNLNDVISAGSKIGCR